MLKSNTGIIKNTAMKTFYRTGNVVMSAGLKALPILTREPQVISGKGCAAKLPEILRKLNVTRVLIVSGPTVGRTVVPAIKANLEANGIYTAHFSEVEANPSVETVEKIRALYLDTHCNGFIGIGGGSPMDAAKAAAARIAKPHTPIDKMAGLLHVLAKVPPIVCIPTTAGTGSEATMGAVISNHAEQHKYAIMDFSITPLYAVLDPELTVGMPPFVTATTGIDALTHAVEAYVTWNYNTNESNRNAEDAVVKIFRYLERAYADGNDIEAREQMLVASYQAGLAFNRAAVGYVHAIAHAIGGIYGTAHGLANSVILPIVLEDYGEAVYPQLAHLAEITGVKDSGSEADKAKAFIAAIRAMNKRMALPTGFDFIEEKDFDAIIDRAMGEALVIYSVPVIYTRERCRHVLNRIVLEA